MTMTSEDALKNRALQDRFLNLQGLWPLKDHRHRWELQQWHYGRNMWVFMESWSHGCPSIAYLQQTQVALPSIMMTAYDDSGRLARLIDCYGGYLLVVLVDGEVWYSTERYP